MSTWFTCHLGDTHITLKPHNAHIKVIITELFPFFGGPEKSGGNMGFMGCLRSFTIDRALIWENE